jgi:hypothetical protein
MTTDRLRQMVQAILVHDWDPIGVAGVPQAADEYDRYVAPVAQMVVAGSSILDLSRHLIRIEVENMGLRGDQDRALSVAAKLRSVAREAPASG